MSGFACKVRGPRKNAERQDLLEYGSHQLGLGLLSVTASASRRGLGPMGEPP